MLHPRSWGIYTARSLGVHACARARASDSLHVQRSPRANGSLSGAQQARAPPAPHNARQTKAPEDPRPSVASRHRVLIPTGCVLSTLRLPPLILGLLHHGSGWRAVTLSIRPSSFLFVMLLPAPAASPSSSSSSSILPLHGRRRRAPKCSASVRTFGSLAL